MRKLLTCFIALAILCSCYYRPIDRPEFDTVTYDTFSNVYLDLQDDYQIEPDYVSLDEIESAFDSKHDLIIAPIDIGVAKILEGSPYKLLAVIGYDHLAVIGEKEEVKTIGCGKREQNLLLDLLGDKYEYLTYDNHQQSYQAYLDGKCDGVLVSLIDMDYQKVDYKVFIDVEDLYSAKYPDYRSLKDGIFVTYESSDDYYAVKEHYFYIGDDIYDAIEKMNGDYSPLEERYRDIAAKYGLRFRYASASSSILEVYTGLLGNKDIGSIYALY